METIDMMNDGHKVSQSFNHSHSKNSNHFEEINQSKKILQTEDERESMSVRRNNFEAYNNSQVVQ